MSTSPTTATAIAKAMRNGDLSAVDIVQAQLQRIASLDPELGAFCSTFDDRATANAVRLDERQKAGESLGPLAGVVIGSKDNLLVENELASAGSRMLSTFRAPFTATSLQRLELHDGLLIGRTNMDEFGMGSTTETSAFQKTRNPFGKDLVPGGSSGGSAVAVAADLCAIAIGSDTGGSVRQPAALCGVTGLKPTYGRVPRYGLIAYASSLDCVGALARTAEDLALWLDCASGQDPADATSLPTPATVSHMLAERSDLKGVRIGVPRELNGEGVDDEVLTATQAAVAQIRDLGGEIIDCALPSAKHAVPAYYLLATAEAASNLARYDGVHYGNRTEQTDPSQQSSIDTTTQSRSEGFGAEVQLRILLGTFASSYGYSAQFYERARLARRALQREFAQLFERCDVLLSPTSPTAAPHFGDHEEDPLARYMWDALTVPASLAGIPALSMPCGQTADGRPIALQAMAKHGHDGHVLQLAHVFQMHSQHHLRRPQL